jgi:hypothetical protein
VVLHWVKSSRTKVLMLSWRKLSLFPSTQLTIAGQSLVRSDVSPSEVVTGKVSRQIHI